MHHHNLGFEDTDDAGHSQRVPIVEPEVHSESRDVIAQAFAAHADLYGAQRGKAALSVLLDWLAGSIVGKHPNGEARRAKFIMTRSYAMLWVIRPETFGSQSLRELAKAVGVSPATLSNYANEFCERFSYPCSGLRAEQASAAQDAREGAEASTA
jgi:hypothetical protein